MRTSEELQSLLDQACDRIRDLLKQDGGQAYKEAEKFLLRLEKEKNHDKTLGPDFPRYQTIEEIIDELNPPEIVMRLWLQRRGCFIGSARDAREDARLHMAGPNDKESIMELQTFYKLGYSTGKIYPWGIRVKDEPPAEITDGFHGQAYKAGFAQGFADRNKEAIRDYEQHLTDQMEKEEAEDAKKIARPDFPDYVKIKGIHGSFTALYHQGDGHYHRIAGAWSLDSKKDAHGVLRIEPGHPNIRHLIGRELVECTKEEHDADNTTDRVCVR